MKFSVKSPGSRFLVSGKTTRIWGRNKEAKDEQSKKIYIYIYIYIFFFTSHEQKLTYK